MYSGILRTELPNSESIDDAENLFAAIEACPDFSADPPSSTFSRFLSRMQDDFPSEETFGEDNVGAGWGHKQYAGGDMTLTSVFASWANVGSPANVAKVLAAAIRISRVARFLCAGITPAPSYVADSYLDSLVRILWACWRAADGVFFFFLYDIFF